MIQLVDDQHLGRLLRREAPPTTDGPVFTTGCWYVRLCQAVLRASGRTGVLSGPFAALPEAARSRAIRGLLELPDEVGLLSLRELGPRIAALRDRHDLNLLGMEALAAAVRLDAAVLLAAPSPRLEAALRAEGREVEVAVP